VLLSASECPLDDNAPDGDGDGDDTPTTPTATVILVQAGDDQAGTVGTTLADPLVVQVNDQFGDPMSGVNVSFSAEAGTVSPTNANTGADGTVSTEWTLGTTAGSYAVTASVTGVGSPAQFNATAAAGAADVLVLVSGDDQNGFPNTALSNPIVVQVQDEYGNAVAGVTVSFSVLSGGGSITLSAVSDADGYAEATWTLGTEIGANTAQASVTGLAGGTLSFAATATMLSVTSVTPAPLVEGATATITGTGFDQTPANNTVTIDGEAAIVTNVVGGNEMTVTVPLFNCRPERQVDVVVSVSGFNETSTGLAMEPATAQLDLSVGEQTIVRDPAEFCLQFEASPTGGDEYLIGVGAAAESPGGVMTFTMASVSGAASSPPAMLSGSSRSYPRPQITVDPDLAALRQRQDEREAEIRAYERRHLDPARNPSIQYVRGRAMGDVPYAAAAMAPSDTLGDERVFRVPGGTCNDYTEITATARVVGESGIWYTDNLNPTDDSLTLADIEAASELFDDFIYPFDTKFFGEPTDIDANSKIVIVLTKEVNTTGAAGFVYSGDLVLRTSCAYSDEGEIFYGYVPDPSADFGYSYSRTSVVNFLPVLIAHEFTHNIQISRRIVYHAGENGVFPASWIAEGQATFAEEVVGHAYTNRSAGNDYGVSVVRDGPPYWYWPGITKLGYYLGYGGFGEPEIVTAPENCTLFGNFDDIDIGDCKLSGFYGASWSMLRYLTDRFYSASASNFHRDIISAYPSLVGVANIEAITDLDFDVLFAQWGAMLYTDNWVPGVPSELEMPSWDLPAVLNEVSPSALLEPEERAFGEFSVEREVRGGSHYYSIVSAASGSRPALAIRVRDILDGLLTETPMTPILWIVRIQ